MEKPEKRPKFLKLAKNIKLAKKFSVQKYENYAKNFVVFSKI